MSYGFLSKEDQDLLLKAADFEGDPEFGWDAWKEAIEVSYNEELLPWQIIVTLDGDGWATLAEKARKEEWDFIEKTVGKDIMDRIRAHAPELPWGLTVDEMNYGWGKILTSEWLIERQGAVYTVSRQRLKNNSIFVPRNIENRRGMMCKIFLAIECSG